MQLEVPPWTTTAEQAKSSYPDLHPWSAQHGPKPVVWLRPVSFRFGGAEFYEEAFDFSHTTLGSVRYVHARRGDQAALEASVESALNVALGPSARKKRCWAIWRSKQAVVVHTSLSVEFLPPTVEDPPENVLEAQCLPVGKSKDAP